MPAAYTPSMQTSPTPTHQLQLSTEQQSPNPSGTFAEMISFMREEREHVKDERAEMDAKLEQQRLDAEAKLEKQRLDTQTMFESQRQEAEAQKKEVEAQKKEADAQTENVREVASAKSCVSEAQLEALQARLDALHQAKLLTDDEVYKLEDCVADFIECRSSVTVAAAEMGAAAETAKKLVGLSEGVAKDGMLARQLRRKFA